MDCRLLALVVVICVDQLPRETINATNELCIADNPNDFNNIACKVIFDYKYDLIVAKPKLIGANHLLIMMLSWH